uniref:Uncharacterized protein n=1 Tax=Rhizophora mucronata TaxID=61149 RepID=A0A2P2L331_RHIMU
MSYIICRHRKYLLSERYQVSRFP